MEEEHRSNKESWKCSGVSYLLHLELDGGTNIFNFCHHGFIVCQHRWKLASLVQTRTNDTWDLLDQRIRSKESIVLLS